MSSLVCVTGATGFVGAYVVRELLARGYRVRAAVRDPKARNKAAHLLALAGAADRLELVAGDLERAGSFDEAIAGVDAVIHTASAVALAAKDPQREIVDVAVNGTRHVLAAALKQKTVKRVVLTSSIAAVVGDNLPKSYVFAEGDWNDTATTQNDAYAASKVQAEREARRMLADSEIELVAILPGLVLGPLMAEQHLRTSPAVLFEIMKGKWPGVPNLHFQVVDVRDVAKAHLAALELAKPGPRYVCTSGPMGLRQMAEELRRVCPKAKIPQLPLPSALMYATALFDPRLTMSFLRRNLGQAPRFDNTRAREDLGIAFTSPRDAVVEAGRSIERLGVL